MFAVGVALSACTGSGPDRAEGDPWQRAEQAFERNDPSAFDLWSNLPNEHPQARAARRRLAAADPHYQEGIRRLAAEDDEGAYEEIVRGLESAPMDPGYYPILARVYVARGNDAEAARFFERYLRARPAASDAEGVRAELRSLSPGASILTVTPPEPAPATPAPAPQPLWIWVALGLVAGVLLAGLVAWIATSLRRRGVGLARLVQEQPELHPAIAYLVGSLRHELLKHRVGAAREVVELLGEGQPTSAQRAFLESRLLGEARGPGRVADAGVGGASPSLPLDHAFDAYVRAFERALGGRFDVRRDRGFRAAQSAIHQVVVLTPKLSARHNARALRRLREAHEVLRSFDAELKQLVDGLIRTDVDAALLEQVVREVREEYAAGAVPLSAVEVEVPEAAAVEVFRIDLILVLKNIFRNAVLATGRGAEPGRVRLSLRVELELTGEETVHLSVSDSSEEPLTLEMIRDREFGRGLGLVTAAVDRYGGAISIEEGPSGFKKSVVVSFPCAYDA